MKEREATQVHRLPDYKLQLGAIPSALLAIVCIGQESNTVLLEAFYS